MIAPRGLVGASLLAWGFALGFPAVGVVLAFAFEGLRFTRMRFVLSDAALARTLQATFLVAIVAFVLLIALRRPPLSLYLWLRSLPVLLAPLPFLQVLADGALPFSALRASLRFSPGDGPRGQTPGSDPGVRPWDATHAYALCCLVAAGTMISADAWYYAVAFAITTWALVARMKARRVAGVALLACAGILGFGVATGLYKLQAQLEEWGEEFLEDLFTPEPDPFRERTRIGDMGRIKLSDRILMRAIPEGPRPMQILLREAAFDFYRNGAWESSRRTLRPVPRMGEAWLLRGLTPGSDPARVVVRRTFPRGEGLLPLPAGASSISGLEAATVEATDTGSVRVKGVNGPVAFRIAYDEDRDVPRAVDAFDREVPESLRPVLEEIVVRDGIRGATPRDSINGLHRFFSKDFAYSLQLSHDAQSRSITDFLLRDRKGHCEYYATATVLLLRQAGVPARYAVGYSAQEFSALEKAFLVRNRHAHAWAEALVDDRWIAVDTTPANWAEEEAQAARSPFGAVLDFFSWAWESAQRLWAASSAAQLAAIAGLAIVLAFLPWIARRLPRFARKTKAAPVDRVTAAWRTIEANAAERGFPRNPTETVREWVRRLASEPAAAAIQPALAELAALYYRARFDPAASPRVIDDFVAQTRGQTPGTDPGVRPRGRTIAR